MSRNPLQMDLFGEATAFPVRVFVDAIDTDRFRARLKRSLARAIRECQMDRAEIAARMSRYLGSPITKASLDSYTAESKTGHDISLLRFKAFVKATGATWLWDELVSDDGLTMMDGDETLLAEIAYWQEEQRLATARIKALRAKPVTMRRRK